MLNPKRIIFRQPPPCFLTAVLFFMASLFNVSAQTTNVNQFATAGAGTSQDPWTSSSGCGGLKEAFQKLPPSGGTLYLPAGWYKIARPCDLSGKSFTLTGAGIGKTFIDASSLTIEQLAGHPVMILGGSLHERVTTTVNVVQQGTTVLPLTNADGIGAGSWLLLRSSDEDKARGEVRWNGGNGDPSYYYKGEWQQVASVSGSVVRTSRPLWDNYVGSIFISMLEPVTVDVSGFTMLGSNSPDNGIACFVLQDAIGSSVHNTETRNCNERGWGLYYVLQSSFHDNVGTEHYPQKPVGTNYGVAIAMGYDLDIYNNRITSGRHAITIGSDAAGGVDRMINIHDNPSLGTEVFYACDVHGIAEYYTWKNNVCQGMVLGGQYGSIVNNTIIRSKPANGAFFLADAKSWNFDIEHNTFVIDSPGTGGGSQIEALMRDVSYARNGRFTFSNNTITVAPNASMSEALVYFSPAAGDHIDMLNFTGNEVVNKVPVSRFNPAASLDFVARGTIGTLNLSNNTITGAGFLIETVGTGVLGQVLISDNVIHGAGADGLYISGASDASFARNTVTDSQGSGIFVNNLRTQLAVQFINNNLCGNGRDESLPSEKRSGAYLYSPSTSHAYKISGNTFCDRKSQPTQQYGLFVNENKATTVRVSNNAIFGNGKSPTVIPGEQPR
ncbi:MAG TPA: right-handed parallel beta-helix repeat-containing protein [Terracidiphilus sp.]|jgi:hypothetical protein